jgi:hypothetical protein
LIQGLRLSIPGAVRLAVNNLGYPGRLTATYKLGSSAPIHHTDNLGDLTNQINRNKLRAQKKLRG